MTMPVRVRGRLAAATRLGVALVVTAVAAMRPTSAPAQPAVKGEWLPVFDTKNVMIHVSVLPNRKVLFWSRREAAAGEGLNPHVCTPRIWDPSKGTGPLAFSETPDKPGYNLFCSGHA